MQCFPILYSQFSLTAGLVTISSVMLSFLKDVIISCYKRPNKMMQYRIQDTRFFISSKLPIVHIYTMFNKMLMTYF